MANLQDIKDGFNSIQTNAQTLADQLKALKASGLSDDQKKAMDALASLAQAGTVDDLEQFVERAFEAGIDCVLGGGEREDKADEPADEAELRHMLLTPLIEHSPARRLVQREALNRAILGTLIQHAMKTPTAAENSPTGLPSERAAPARAN